MLPEESSIQHLEYIADELMDALQRVAQRGNKGEIQSNKIIKQVAAYLNQPDADIPLRVKNMPTKRTLQRVDERVKRRLTSVHFRGWMKPL